MRRDLEFIGDALAKAVEARTQSGRVARGLELRQQLGAAARAGLPVSHYRIDWLRESAKRVVALAQTCCREFDAQHQDDTASAADLLDVLQTAAAIVMEAVKITGR